VSDEKARSQKSFFVYIHTQALNRPTQKINMTKISCFKSDYVDSHFADGKNSLLEKTEKWQKLLHT
jgi:hypothetical protein